MSDSDGFLGDNAVARVLPGGWGPGGILVTQAGLALTPGVTRDFLNANS